MMIPKGPQSARDFLRVAEQRLTTAEFLGLHGYNLDAAYLAGYAIECSLKAVILHRTAETQRELMRNTISRGSSMHDFENLKARAAALGKPLPASLVKLFRRYPWSTALRYEYGRRSTSETRGLLKVAQKMILWASGELQ